MPAFKKYIGMGIQKAAVAAATGSARIQTSKYGAKASKRMAGAASRTRGAMKSKRNRVIAGSAVAAGVTGAVVGKSSGARSSSYNSAPNQSMYGF